MTQIGQNSVNMCK